jgi:phytol kinase
MTALDFGKIAFLLALVATLLYLLRLYQLRGEPRPNPELVRKLFHIGGGGLGLLLPWVFDSLVPVLILSAVMVGTFLAMRFVQRVRGGVGQVLLGVNRSSVGEFGYITSVCLLFWLSAGDKLLYSVPLLIVALADAFAALVGEQYGKLHLHMAGARKTYEGIFTFMLTAFFCVHVPVLLSAQTGRLESLLVAVAVSAMVMMAEVAAWWGLDNFIVPIWSYMLLKSMVRMSAVELVSHITLLVVLTLFVRLWRNRTVLGDDALFGATLWSYVVWAVAGWRWLLPPAMQLAVYAVLTARVARDKPQIFRFPIVLANIAGSMLWLLIYRQTDNPALLLPFAACFGANTAIIALVRQKTASPAVPARRAISTSVVQGLLVLVPPALAFDGLALNAVFQLAFGFIAVYVATVLFYAAQPGLSDFPNDAGRWLRQVIIVTATSTLALGLHYGVLLVVSMPTLRDLLEIFE